MSDRLTHLDEHGDARMVDVGGKPVTARRAVARATVRMSAGRRRAIVRGRRRAEGRRAGTARIAGIMAAKRTGELIPLCHPMGLDHVDVDASRRCRGRHGHAHGHGRRHRAHRRRDGGDDRRRRSRR